MPKSETRAASQPHAAFSYQNHGEIIVIFDEKMVECSSVENDAEAVIKELGEKFDLSRFRVIYQNTNGIWDELVIRDGRFANFRSTNEPTLDAALAKIRTEHKI